jgi:hypothetical protein
MKPHQIPSADKGGSFSLPIPDLKSLYFGTIEELRDCADYVPSDLNDDPDMDAREAALLDFEGHLLEQAARTPLKNSQDMQAMMDIWMEAVGGQEQSDLSATEKLVLNIFRGLKAGVCAD